MASRVQLKSQLRHADLLLVAAKTGQHHWAPPLNIVPSCFNNENLLNHLVNKILRYIVLFISLS